MRFIRRILLLAIVAVVAVLGYNYWSGSGWTLRSATPRGIDAEAATRRGAELTKAAAQKTGDAVTKLEAAVGQGDACFYPASPPVPSSFAWIAGAAVPSALRSTRAKRATSLKPSPPAR